MFIYVFPQKRVWDVKKRKLASESGIEKMAEKTQSK